MCFCACVSACLHMCVRVEAGSHTALGRTGCRLLVADQQGPCAPVSWGWRLGGYAVSRQSSRGEARRMEAVGQCALRGSCTEVGGGHAATMELSASSDRWAAVN